MREFSNRKTSPAKVLMAVLLIAAVVFAVLSPLYIANNVASAEAWPSGYATTYTYERGFTAEPGSITKVVYNDVEYDSGIPESLGVVNSTAAGMKFGGFEIGGRTVATLTAPGELTVTDTAFFGTGGGTVTLTPVFTEVVYTVTYNPNLPEGEIWTNPNPATYDISDGSVSLTAPTRTGYTFTGWEIENAPGTQLITSLDSYVAGLMAGNEIILTAQWAERTYSLVVSIEGQQSAVYNAAAGTPIGAYMGSYSHPAAPSGMEFVGWRIDGEIITDLSAYPMPAKNVTVEAVFAAPQIVVPVDIKLADVSGGTYTTHNESVKVTAGAYTPSQLAAMLSSALRTGFSRESVVWADDGTTAQRQIDAGADGADFRITCTYDRMSYTITVNYRYDLDGDGVADDINGDGVADSVATPAHAQAVYGATYSVSSPEVTGLQAIHAAVSGTATGDSVVEVLYTTAPEKRTASVAGIGGTVQNDKGGLLDTSVTVGWDTAAAGSHSAIAATTSREAYGVLNIDIVRAENAVFGVRGVYTVTVDLGESMSNIDNYIVYKINDDGTYAPVAVRMDGSKLQLTIDSSGDYLVVGTTVPMDPTLIWVIVGLLIFIILLIIILILILLLVRKKSVTLVTGVEGAEPTTIKAKKGSIIELPVPEEREGFVFAGWYLDEECTQPVQLEPEEEEKAEDGGSPENPDDTPGGGAAADIAEETKPEEEATPEEEVKPEDEVKPEEEAKPEEEIRIYDEPGGRDVTDDQQGGGDGNAMSSKRAKKAKNKHRSVQEEAAEAAPEAETLAQEEALVREELSGQAVSEEENAEGVSAEAPAEEAAEEAAPAAEAEITLAEAATETEEAAAEEVAAEEPTAEETAAEETAAEAPEEASAVEEGETYYADAEETAPAAEEIPVLPEVMRYKVTGNVKLYARWVEKPPEEHIIGFIAGGYVAAVLHTMGKEVLTLPEAHELEGYEFAGWFMTEEGREQPFTADAYAEKYLYKDFVVYGQYDKLPEPEVVPEPVPEPEPEPVVPHVISFIVDGEVVATVETAGRDALDLPAAPVKEGFKFRGWFTDEETHENAVEESSFVDKDLEEDINVYAFYEEEKEEEPEEEEVAAAVLPEEDEEEAEEEQEEEDETPEVEETEEDEEAPEEEDGAPRLITAEDARKRRTSTMRGRLRYGSDVNKTIYEELVNHLLSYRNVSRSLTNRADNFKHKGSLLAKITLTGKTIKLFLPLDAEQYEYDKYHQLITEKKGYEEVPFTLKVKSNRGLKYAKELIDETMAQKQVDKKKKTDRKSFKELIMLQKGSLLIKAKKTDKLRSRVDSQDANAQLTDAEALELIRIKNVPYTDEVKKTAFVGLDKIQDLYNDCEMVNIRTLRKRGLVKEEHNRVKIIGGGTLTKSLKVYADEYSLTAVKMIVLLGGKVVKLVEETLEPAGEEQN